MCSVGAGGRVPSPPPWFGSRAEPEWLWVRSGSSLAAGIFLPRGRVHGGSPPVKARGPSGDLSHDPRGSGAALGCGHTGPCAKQTRPGPGTGAGGGVVPVLAAALPPAPTCCADLEEF